VQKLRLRSQASLHLLWLSPNMIWGIGLFVLALQVAHALGLGFQQSVWWYLVGLTWLLVSAGYLFYLAIRGWARVACPAIAADHQQLVSIDVLSRLAAYFGGRIGCGQRCCWPLSADPLGGVSR